jgi:hypothetical protein
MRRLRFVPLFLVVVFSTSVFAQRDSGPTALSKYVGLDAYLSNSRLLGSRSRNPSSTKNVHSFS